MALRIRLKRMGRKKRPFYRLVVAESSTPRDGKTVEDIGVYDPSADPLLFEVKEDRVSHWISVGAKPSEPVQRLLGNAGLVDKEKRESSLQGVPRKDRKAQTSEES